MSELDRAKAHGAWMSDIGANNGDAGCCAELYRALTASEALVADMAEALREIDSEAASKEPPTGRTSDDPDEAFHEGYVRGLWEAATRARAALAKGGA